MKTRHIRIALEPTTLTHLMCVYCGDFKTELAIVAPNGKEPVAGVHKSCAKQLHSKRASAAAEAS